MVVTYYIKPFRTGADRHNAILMSLLLLVAETRYTFNISFSWLQHVQKQMLPGEEYRDENLSWSAYHASQCIQEKDADLSVLIPLFREDSKLAAMIKHGMDVVKQAVSHLNS